VEYEKAIEEIKNSAPKSATHFNCLGGHFKKVSGLWYLYSPFTNKWMCTGLDKFENLEPIK
jgi:hypothetical protein